MAPPYPVLAARGGSGEVPVRAIRASVSGRSACDKCEKTVEVAPLKNRATQRSDSQCSSVTKWPWSPDELHGLDLRSSGVDPVGELLAGVTKRRTNHCLYLYNFVICTSP